MEVIEKIQEKKINVGQFYSWLELTRKTLMKQETVHVPCGECTACCQSSYFIHIGSNEIQTLSLIPDELKFPAPGLPEGNVLLGYDENGRCPMFINDKCSIYEYRPKTCRTFDCRVFPATGLQVNEDEKELISRQAKRWSFNFLNENEYEQLAAIKATAKFLSKHSDCFPDSFIPRNTTQQAILAIKVYPVFLNFPSVQDSSKMATEYINIAKAVVNEFEKFENESYPLLVSSKAMNSFAKKSLSFK